MPCFSPLEAFQPLAGGPLVWAERGDVRPLSIACGQCIGCRLERSRAWAVRVLHENKAHDVSCFVTLTYDDTHIPVDHSLRYKDFQLFMKRLRARYSLRQRIRFFMCGEYGEVTLRPHYHACIFGVRFDDGVLFKQNRSGFSIYTSRILSSLWPFGHSSFGDVSFESAAYVARYIVKKRFGDVANEHSHYKYIDDYGEVHYREPEFAHMSLKPGIGALWFDEFSDEVYPQDEVVVRGKRMLPPKYYDKLLEARDPEGFEFLQFVRYKKSLGLAEDATPDRLRVRETVARARLAFKRRTLE